MIVEIAEIPSSILTVIAENSYLYYSLTNALLYCEILFKAEVQTELVSFLGILVPKDNTD